jgi:HNH endonuclease
MSALPVEWVLVIYYGPSAHRATYGRLAGTSYTKDYIQLSRTNEFMESLTGAFGATTDNETSVPITFQWPTGSATGEIVFRSADRPHLKWETSQGAPKAWKMSLNPSEAVAETIIGDPTHNNPASADQELTLLNQRGAGQPYLLAIKLRGEQKTLHLRTYLGDPETGYMWASTQLVPPEIKTLIDSTSRNSALGWSAIQSGGRLSNEKVEHALGQLLATGDPGPVLNSLDTETSATLMAYLENPAFGLFFDPKQNHDAWIVPDPISDSAKKSFDELLGALHLLFPKSPERDAFAETLETSADEVMLFVNQINNTNYRIDDAYATTKTRGSAQKAFADAVKSNYGFSCAVTGIGTKDFLVAAHIVPWSHDPDIRLDPSNGICLSVLMDRAFEIGYLTVKDDLTIEINWDKVGEDLALRDQLSPYDGKKLLSPSKQPPNPDFLRRRRDQVS